MKVHNNSKSLNATKTGQLGYIALLIRNNTLIGVYNKELLVIECFSEGNENKCAFVFLLWKNDSSQTITTRNQEKKHRECLIKPHAERAGGRNWLF